MSDSNPNSGHVADSGKPRRKRLAGSDARNVVLDAAEALLREGGPQALRLGEIAARAGLSHSNVLYHFNGMTDLEGQLASRIAHRLAADVAAICARPISSSVPIEQANQKLFEVMSEGDSGTMLWWLLQASKNNDVSSFAQRISELCDLIASQPALAKVPKHLARIEVGRSVQLSVCAALGYGLLKERFASLFGTTAEAAAIPDLLSDLQRGRVRAALALAVPRPSEAAS